MSRFFRSHVTTKVVGHIEDRLAQTFGDSNDFKIEKSNKSKTVMVTRKSTGSTMSVDVSKAKFFTASSSTSSWTLDLLYRIEQFFSAPSETIDTITNITDDVKQIYAMLTTILDLLQKSAIAPTTNLTESPAGTVSSSVALAVLEYALKFIVPDPTQIINILVAVQAELPTIIKDVGIVLNVVEGVLKKMPFDTTEVTSILDQIETVLSKIFPDSVPAKTNDVVEV